MADFASIAGLFSLEGRTVLVTGARRGIGLAIARTCAAAGAHVVINDLDASEAQAQADVLRAQGHQASSAAFDVCDRQAVDTAVAGILARQGRIDALVSNAGIQDRRPFTEFTPAQWQAMLGTHVNGAFNLCQSVIPSMVAAGGGSIVMVGSILATSTRGTLSPYAAAKGAIHSLARELAQEYGPQGIRCNVIAPGFISTELTRGMVANEDHNRWVQGRVPLRRWGTPEDLAPGVLYLLSDAGRYVSGHVLTVDGGVTAAL